MDQSIKSPIIARVAFRQGGALRPPRQRPVGWTIPGFCASALITTTFGELPVQVLRKRDPLRTTQGKVAMVEWVDRIKVDAAFLDANPDARPVRIPAGAFGPNRPANDLMVSPQQMVNVSPVPSRQEFCLARQLTAVPGITRVRPADEVNYHIFHCGAPVVVMVEGIGAPVTP